MPEALDLMSSKSRGWNTKKGRRGRGRKEPTVYIRF